MVWEDGTYEGQTDHRRPGGC